MLYLKVFACDINAIIYPQQRKVWGDFVFAKISTPKQADAGSYSIFLQIRELIRLVKTMNIIKLIIQRPVRKQTLEFIKLFWPPKIIWLESLKIGISPSAAILF